MTDEEKRFDRREEARLDAMYDAGIPDEDYEPEGGGMKPTQEQVIAWAREVLNAASGTDYYDYTGEVHWWGEVESVVLFATLAYEAGRKDENESCAKVCEWVGQDKNHIGIAAAIRARGQA